MTIISKYFNIFSNTDKDDTYTVFGFDDRYEILCCTSTGDYNMLFYKDNPAEMQEYEEYIQDLEESCLRLDQSWGYLYGRPIPE